MSTFKPVASHINAVMRSLEAPGLPPFEDMNCDQDWDSEDEGPTSLFDQEQQGVSTSLSGVNLWRI